MNSIGMLVGGTVVVLAYVANPSSATTLLKDGLYAMGLTVVCTKIVKMKDGDASDLITIAGYSMAGISAIKLLSLGMSSFNPLFNGVNKLALFFNNLGTILDKITFWN